jgi:hypothetical protein
MCVMPGISFVIFQVEKYLFTVAKFGVVMLIATLMIKITIIINLIGIHECRNFVCVRESSCDLPNCCLCLAASWNRTYIVILPKCCKLLVISLPKTVL